MCIKNKCKDKECNNLLIKNQKYYCSKQCYNKNRIKYTGTERAKKLSLSISFYALNNREEIKQRGIKISNKKIKNSIIKLTKEEELKIKNILDLKYTNNHIFIAEQLNIQNKANKILQYVRKHNYKGTFISKNIQKLNAEQFKKFCIEYTSVEWDNICKKYKLSKKELISAGIKLKLGNYIYKKINIGETQIEKIIRLILENNNIEYKQNGYINNLRWRYDFLLKNKKIIEIDGDYWHANPKFYPDINKLTKVQLKNIINDKNKDKWYKENNYQILRIWGNDIITDINNVTNKILKYATN